MITFNPLDRETWGDLESLFGENGACGGCWCMYWRLTHKEYEKKKGNANKKIFRGMVKKEQPLGVLAYDRNMPVGWCSVSPRNSLVRLERSRLFGKIDEKPVWSIVCLFVEKNYRRQGISEKLIRAAVQYAFEKGATVIEAYPIIPKAKRMPDAFSWVGFVDSYRKAGFKKVSQPSENRLYMRLHCCPR
jgi:GNAT superfamily N-acetyltransferase